MVLLAIGLALFLVTHLSDLAPVITARLRNRLGVWPYRAVYSLLATGALLLIIVGYDQAVTGVVYYPPAWAQSLAHATIPIAFILVAAALLPTNIRRFIPRPAAVGVLIWALTHLVANGLVQDVAMFGVFAVYALIDILLLGPRASAALAQPRRKDVIVVSVGLALYLVVFLIHTQLIYIGGPIFD